MHKTKKPSDYNQKGVFILPTGAGVLFAGPDAQANIRNNGPGWNTYSYGSGAATFEEQRNAATSILFILVYNLRPEGD